MGRQIYFNSYGNEIDPPEADEPKQTNADRIRAMTDEELAEFFASIQLDSHDYLCDGEKQKYPFPHKWLEWLKEEVRE